MALIYVKLNRQSFNERTSGTTFGTRPIAGLAGNYQFENVANQTRSEGPGKGLARKITQSLALEKGMLSRLHLIGVVPVP